MQQGVQWNTRQYICRVDYHRRQLCKHINVDRPLIPTCSAIIFYGTMSSVPPQLVVGGASVVLSA